MKRPLNFWDKISFFIQWMRDQEGYGLKAKCDICNSTKIERLASLTNRVGEIVLFNATYRCVNCNSKADVREVWIKGEEA